MSKTDISWCQFTWNPIVGCSKCSPGCRFCFAERMAKRLKGMGLPQYKDVVDKNGWTGETRYHFSKLPNKPALMFVSSMGDFFHESVTDSMHQMAFNDMCENQQHTYILLTKRPEKMRDYINSHQRDLPNKLWCMVTCCTQKEIDNNLIFLNETNCKIKGISIEPILEPIQLRWLNVWRRRDGSVTHLKHDSLKHQTATGHLDGLKEFSWVIVGGESGPGARPINPTWVREIRVKCAEAGVPFHFKQWGEWVPFGSIDGGPDGYSSEKIDRNIMMPWSDIEIDRYDKQHWADGKKICHFNDGNTVIRVGKKQAGRTLSGITHDGFPEV